MNKGKLLMISTDRLIFDEKSNVRARQIEYAKDWEEVHIVIFEARSREKGGRRKLQISPNCWVYSTGSSSKFLYPFDAIKIGRQIISEHKITEITCQDSSLTAMVGASLKKQFNIPLEIQIHTDIGSSYFTYTFANKIRKMMARRYLPQADKIRVVSERIKKYLTEKLQISHSKIEVRPIRIDTEWIKNAPVLVDLHRKYRQFEKIVLMASRLESEKNITTAIKAWKKVIVKYTKAGLIIVGRGSQRKILSDLIDKLGLKDSVIIEDWVSREILISYYKTADLFLNTSLFEGYGLTLVEAKAADCKIVSTDVGVSKEVGATIVENNAEDLAKKVIEILEHD